MSKPNGRRVRMSQFKQQVAEAVLPPDGLVSVELDDEGDSVSFQIPVRFDGTEDEMVEQIKKCETAAEITELVLGADQRQRWLAAGYTDQDFAFLLASETRGAQERMRDFRYRPSGR